MAIITRTFYMRLPCHRHAPRVQKVALVVSLVEEKANREKTWQVVEKCWWARQDSNLKPARYERPALTIELQAPPRAIRSRANRQRCPNPLQRSPRSGNARLAIPDSC